MAEGSDGNWKDGDKQPPKSWKEAENQEQRSAAVAPAPGEAVHDISTSKSDSTSTPTAVAPASGEAVQYISTSKSDSTSTPTAISIKQEPIATIEQKKWNKNEKANFNDFAYHHYALEVHAPELKKLDKNYSVVKLFTDQYNQLRAAYNESSDIVRTDEELKQDLSALEKLEDTYFKSLSQIFENTNSTTTYNEEFREACESISFCAGFIKNDIKEQLEQSKSSTLKIDATIDTNQATLAEKQSSSAPSAATSSTASPTGQSPTTSAVAQNSSAPSAATSSIASTPNSTAASAKTPTSKPEAKDNNSRPLSEKLNKRHNVNTEGRTRKSQPLLPPNTNKSSSITSTVATSNSTAASAATSSIASPTGQSPITSAVAQNSSASSDSKFEYQHITNKPLSKDKQKRYNVYESWINSTTASANKLSNDHRSVISGATRDRGTNKQMGLTSEEKLRDDNAEQRKDTTSKTIHATAQNSVLTAPNSQRSNEVKSDHLQTLAPLGGSTKNTEPASRPTTPTGLFFDSPFTPNSGSGYTSDGTLDTTSLSGSRPTTPSSPSSSSSSTEYDNIKPPSSLSPSKSDLTTIESRPNTPSPTPRSTISGSESEEFFSLEGTDEEASENQNNTAQPSSDAISTLTDDTSKKAEQGSVDVKETSPLADGTQPRLKDSLDNLLTTKPTASPTIPSYTKDDSKAINSPSPSSEGNLKEFNKNNYRKDGNAARKLRRVIRDVQVAETGSNTTNIPSITPSKFAGNTISRTRNNFADTITQDQVINPQETTPPDALPIATPPLSRTPASSPAGTPRTAPSTPITTPRDLLIANVARELAAGVIEEVTKTANTAKTNNPPKDDNAESKFAANLRGEVAGAKSNFVTNLRGEVAEAKAIAAKLVAGVIEKSITNATETNAAPAATAPNNQPGDALTPATNAAPDPAEELPAGQTTPGAAPITPAPATPATNAALTPVTNAALTTAAPTPPAPGASPAAPPAANAAPTITANAAPITPAPATTVTNTAPAASVIEEVTKNATAAKTNNHKKDDNAKSKFAANLRGEVAAARVAEDEAEVTSDVKIIGGVGSTTATDEVVASAGQPTPGAAPITPPPAPAAPAAIAAELAAAAQNFAAGVIEKSITNATAAKTNNHKKDDNAESNSIIVPATPAVSASAPGAAALTPAAPATAATDAALTPPAPTPAETAAAEQPIPTVQEEAANTAGQPTPRAAPITPATPPAALTPAPKTNAALTTATPAAPDPTAITPAPVTNAAPDPAEELPAGQTTPRPDAVLTPAPNNQPGAALTTAASASLTIIPSAATNSATAPNNQPGAAFTTAKSDPLTITPFAATDAAGQTTPQPDVVLTPAPNNQPAAPKDPSAHKKIIQLQRALNEKTKELTEQQADLANQTAAQAAAQTAKIDNLVQNNAQLQSQLAASHKKQQEQQHQTPPAGLESESDKNKRMMGYCLAMLVGLLTFGGFGMLMAAAYIFISNKNHENNSARIQNEQRAQQHRAAHEQGLTIQEQQHQTIGNLVANNNQLAAKTEELAAKTEELATKNKELAQTVRILQKQNFSMKGTPQENFFDDNSSITTSSIRSSENDQVNRIQKAKPSSHVAALESETNGADNLSVRGL